MASFKQRGRNWYYTFIDADGRAVQRKGCPDRRETERMALHAEIEAARVREGLSDPQDSAYRRHEARPLADHLDDWRKDMQARGKTGKHIDLYYERAGKLAALVRGARLADLEPGRNPEALERAAVVLAGALKAVRLSDLTPERIQAALATLRDAGKSNQTVNHYRAALRAFVRWAGDKGRFRDNPMRGVKGYNAEEDIRHERRSLTDEELARLIRVAESGPVVFGMPGPLRAMAYRVAAATGFRVQELRSLTAENFRLDGPKPTVFLRASSTKNRRPANQPIPLALARDLHPWVAGKPPGQPVFPLHHETAKAIRRDLEAAGIPYATDEGVADFHSLRAYYISALVRSGATIKEVQTLARHAKPQTTLNHYAKVSAHDLRGAVESLPDPATRPEAMASTGTDGSHVVNPFAQYLPNAGDGIGRDVTESDGSKGEGMQMITKADESQVLETDGLGRTLTASDGMERRGGDSNPRGHLSHPNGLANRRRVDVTPNPAKDFRLISGDLPNDPALLPPDLAQVIDAWPNLPEPIRVAILSLVQASAKSGKA